VKRRSVTRINGTVGSRAHGKVHQRPSECKNKKDLTGPTRKDIELHNQLGGEVEGG